MKEFEKWSKKYMPRNLHSKAYGEAAWKAALEWMLAQQCHLDWRFSFVILPEVIEEELND